MKTITINSQKHGIHTVLVDDEDFDYLSNHTWNVNKQGANKFRVFTSIKRKHFYMHRIILKYPVNSIDHIDGNTLNNQKSNLRICTQKQNTQNSKVHKDNSSGYKGVFYCKSKNTFIAKIMVNGVSNYLMSSKCKEDCAKAYNEAAIKYHGEFAWLNPIPNG